jgi:hypothetical protein
MCTSSLLAISTGSVFVATILMVVSTAYRRRTPAIPWLGTHLFTCSIVFLLLMSVSNCEMFHSEIVHSRDRSDRSIIFMSSNIMPPELPSAEKPEAQLSPPCWEKPSRQPTSKPVFLAYCRISLPNGKHLSHARVCQLMV